MKSGTETALCYKAYCVLAAAEFLKMVPNYSHGDKNYALMFITPGLLGGLSGKILQTFDNTLKSSSSSEPLSLLTKLGKIDPDVKHYFIKMMMSLD